MGDYFKLVKGVLGACVVHERKLRNLRAMPSPHRNQHLGSITMSSPSSDSSVISVTDSESWANKKKHTVRTFDYTFKRVLYL